MLNTILSWFGYRLISEECFVRLADVAEAAKNLSDYHSERDLCDPGSVADDLSQGRIAASRERLKMRLQWCNFSGQRFDGVHFVKYLR